MEQLQPYDFIILIILGVCTLRGFFKGMASQVATLALIIVTWWAAVQFSPAIAPSIKADPPWNRVLAIFLIFVVVYIGVTVFYRMVDGIIKKIRLKSFDRLLGAVFGLIKGIALGMILTFFAVTLSTMTCDKALSSKSGVYLSLLLEKTAKNLPEDVNGLLAKNLEAFRETLDNRMENSDESSLINSSSEKLNNYFTKAHAVQEIHENYKKLTNPADEKPSLNDSFSQENEEGFNISKLIQSLKPVQTPTQAPTQEKVNGRTTYDANPPITIPADPKIVPNSIFSQPDSPDPNRTSSSKQPIDPTDPQKLESIGQRWLELMLSE